MQIIKYLVLCYKMFYHNNNNNIVSFDNLEYTILPHLLRNTIFGRLLDPHSYIFNFCYKFINNFLTTMNLLEDFSCKW